MKAGIPSTWNLDYRRCPGDDDASGSDSADNNESTYSKGSGITVNELLVVSATSNVVSNVVGMPATPTTPIVLVDQSLETPPDKRSVRQKQPDDCHILVCWSALFLIYSNRTWFALVAKSLLLI